MSANSLETKSLGGPSLFEEVLHSAGPHSGLALEEQIFAPFIGSWELNVKWYDDDVVTRQEKGEWHFFWVLEGRAVQDVWIVPPRCERNSSTEPYEYGTSIRFYDPNSRVWRSTWIGPIRHALHTFVAERVNAAVILTTIQTDGSEMRWVFSGIETDRFRWRNEQKRYGEWLLTQTFEARRISDLLRQNKWVEDE